jgi:hypothetical protein
MSLFGLAHSGWWMPATTWSSSDVDDLTTTIDCWSSATILASIAAERRLPAIASSSIPTYST